MFLTLAETSALSLGPIMIGLLGGLALFLFGIELMSEALKQAAGDGMRKILAKLTTNRFTAVLAGAVVTAIIQSSSVTTVLLVGFISAGLMNFTQAIGVIMGANIGTTITAQIIAFKVTHFALAFIALGFFLQFIFKREAFKNYGNIILGLGLIFLGMTLMSDAMEPLRTYPPFIDLMKNLSSPLLAILFAALFTGLVQSSSATTGIVIVLASQGLLTLDAGIALLFGANVGTCITAGLAALGKTREAQRAVFVHFLFNVLGVAVWFFFIPQLANIVTDISPQSTELEGTARLAADTPRQVANAQAIFNIANTLIFIGFVTPMAWFVVKVLPDKPGSHQGRFKPIHLDDVLLETPPLALDAVRNELGRLGADVLRLTRNSYRTIINGSKPELDALKTANHEIGRHHSSILAYLAKLSQSNIDESHSQLINRYLSATNYFANIGDMVENSFTDAGYQRIAANLTIGKRTDQMLSDFHAEVCRNLASSIRSLVDRDANIAAEVTDAKPKIEALFFEADQHLAKRLVAGEPNRLIAYRLESEIIEYFKRIYYFAKRVAKLAPHEAPSTQSDTTDS